MANQLNGSKNKYPLQFNRNEWAGAFGDIGTDFPLIVAMILAAGLDPASVLIMFGLMQIITALIYRMPMPVQPLKAMAAIVITQKIEPQVLYGGGLAIGIVMLFLTLTHLIKYLAKLIPNSVIRGIQFGLGIKLSMLALEKYVPADGTNGFWLAALVFFILAFLIGNKKYPAALFAIIIGIVYAFLFKISGAQIVHSAGFNLPEMNLPTMGNILTGFVLLALPQIPLSLGNSILATKQVSADYFPDRKDVTVNKISYTYSFINLINPFFSGIPTCHGSGGMVGHYTFGGRSGGSVIIYGSIYLILGLFFSAGFGQIMQLFPLPVLGIILLFEGLALMLLIRDISHEKSELIIALMVAIIAAGLQYGFVIGLIVGTLFYYLHKKGFMNLLR